MMIDDLEATRRKVEGARRRRQRAEDDERRFAERLRDLESRGEQPKCTSALCTHRAMWLVDIPRATEPEPVCTMHLASLLIHVSDMPENDGPIMVTRWDQK